MKSGRPFIIYIHGFNSAPASEKARQFQAWCQENPLPDGLAQVAVPALSHDPAMAIAQLESIITGNGENPALLVGSSLGGYYATWLAEKYNCRAALVNPAVSPVKTLGEEFLGPQKNLYTGEEYEFTREHALFLDTLDIDPLVRPENFLLLAQTDDEVLDYRLAVDRYAGSCQIIQKGGSHRFDGFEDVIPAMIEFAIEGRLSQNTMAALAR